MSDERSDTASLAVVFMLILGTLVIYTGILFIGIVAAGSSDTSTRAMHRDSESINSPSDASANNFAATVEITNMLKFEPYEVTIKAGQTVLWKNVSFVTHTVTADYDLAADKSHVMLPDGAQPFNSDLIDPEKTWTKTFSVPGRYRYYCIPHEATGMVGEVVVE